MSYLSRLVVMPLVLVTAVITSAGIANAAIIQLDFDFTAESFLSMLGGAIVTPPDGTFDSGTVRVQVEATDPNTVVAGGQVAVSLGGFAGTVAKNFAGAANISGPFSGSQVGTLIGILDTGLASATFVDNLMLDLNINFGCVGSGCASLGFPVSVLGLNALSLGTVPLTGLGTPGTARIAMVTNVELGGVLGQLNLVGNETSRLFIVPEPQTALLVSLGLVALGARRS